MTTNLDEYSRRENSAFDPAHSLRRKVYLEKNRYEDELREQMEAKRRSDEEQKRKEREEEERLDRRTREQQERMKREFDEETNKKKAKDEAVS